MSHYKNVLYSKGNHHLNTDMFFSGYVSSVSCIAISRSMYCMLAMLYKNKVALAYGRGGLEANSYNAQLHLMLYILLPTHAFSI